MSWHTPFLQEAAPATRGIQNEKEEAPFLSLLQWDRNFLTQRDSPFPGNACSLPGKSFGAWLLPPTSLNNAGHELSLCINMPDEQGIPMRKIASDNPQFSPLRLKGFLQ